MREKKANIWMAAVIAVMLLGGIAGALHLRGARQMLKAEGSSAVLSEDASAMNTCTIEIRCDTVLDILELLPEAKRDYIPENGCVLQKSQVAIREGDSAFDILQRACQEAQIQLEYSMVPVYESYYVEGINHLYEFDCGSESGWMYEVNGEYPNSGCSSYLVQPGDSILWRYSSSGLGQDLGAERVRGS